jgi:hypothetical protein
VAAQLRRDAGHCRLTGRIAPTSPAMARASGWLVNPGEEASSPGPRPPPYSVAAVSLRVLDERWRIQPGPAASRRLGRRSPLAARRRPTSSRQWREGLESIGLILRSELGGESRRGSDLGWSAVPGHIQDDERCTPTGTLRKVLAHAAGPRTFAFDPCQGSRDRRPRSASPSAAMS